MLGKTFFRLVILLVFLNSPAFSYSLGDHPRIFVNRAALAGLARRAQGVLNSEYASIKLVADRAVAEGVKPPRGRYGQPLDLVCCGICYLVERQVGADPEPYARAVRDYWGDGRWVFRLSRNGF